MDFLKKQRTKQDVYGLQADLLKEEANIKQNMKLDQYKNNKEELKDITEKLEQCQNAIALTREYSAHLVAKKAEGLIQPNTKNSFKTKLSKSQRKSAEKYFNRSITHDVIGGTDISHKIGRDLTKKREYRIAALQETGSLNMESTYSDEERVHLYTNHNMLMATTVANKYYKDFLGTIMKKYKMSDARVERTICRGLLRNYKNINGDPIDAEDQKNLNYNIKMLREIATDENSLKKYGKEYLNRLMKLPDPPETDSLSGDNYVENSGIILCYSDFKKLAEPGSEKAPERLFGSAMEEMRKNDPEAYAKLDAKMDIYTNLSVVEQQYLKAKGIQYDSPKKEWFEKDINGNQKTYTVMADALKETATEQIKAYKKEYIEDYYNESVEKFKEGKLLEKQRVYKSADEAFNELADSLRTGAYEIDKCKTTERDKWDGVETARKDAAIAEYKKDYDKAGPPDDAATFVGRYNTIKWDNRLCDGRYVMPEEKLIEIGIKDHDRLLGGYIRTVNFDKNGQPISEIDKMNHISNLKLQAALTEHNDDAMMDCIKRMIQDIINIEIDKEKLKASYVLKNPVYFKEVTRNGEALTCIRQLVLKKDDFAKFEKVFPKSAALMQKFVNGKGPGVDDVMELIDAKVDLLGQAFIIQTGFSSSAGVRIANQASCQKWDANSNDEDYKYDTLMSDIGFLKEYEKIEAKYKAVRDKMGLF